MFSANIKEHLEHIRILFQRLREADLKLSKRKCCFLKAHVQYLGHYISGSGLEPLPEKLENLKRMPPPTEVTGVRKFLGFIGYYWKFIPRYSDIARPLTNLTHKDEVFDWSGACQGAFEMLKEALLKEPILKYPDPSKLYVLYSDASKYAWAGRVLYAELFSFLDCILVFFCFVLCFCFMRHGVFYHLVQLNTINVFKIKTNLYFHFDKVVLYNF